MDIVEKYLLYRRTGKDLNSKVIEASMSKSIFYNGAKMLKMFKSGTVVFDDEFDMDCLSDFTLNELDRLRGNEQMKSQTKKRNSYAWYLSKYKGTLSQIEKEILNGILSSYSSFFQILSVEKPFLKLKDLLNEESEEIRLIDLSLSGTSQVSYLLFARIIPLEFITISSGIVFPFLPEIKKKAIIAYRRFQEKNKGLKNESILRFLFFYGLFKKYGLELGLLNL